MVLLKRNVLSVIRDTFSPSILQAAVGRSRVNLESREGLTISLSRLHGNLQHPYHAGQAAV